VTLALVLRCADGLVMATDSRVTGDARGSADISEKFLQVNRDVGIMTYGLAVPGYRGIRGLVEEVRQNTNKYTTVSAITTQAQTVCKEVFKTFLEDAKQPDGTIPPQIHQASVGYIIGGYDGNDTARFVIYSCSNQEAFHFQEQYGTWFMAAQWPLLTLPPKTATP
jgi:20S proteasome alpha/beta subunit